MTPALGTEGLQYETIDVNIVNDLYVTWIVDIWDGDRNDPAVDIIRYIGVWDADALEDDDGNAVDPTFKKGQYSGVTPSHKPRHWEQLDHIKKSDGAARSFKKQSDEMLDPERYAGYGLATSKTKYMAFMDAIDTLVSDPENAEAWAAVDAWRAHNAQLHEK
jgi:hypothetical protein